MKLQLGSFDMQTNWERYLVWNIYVTSSWLGARVNESEIQKVPMFLFYKQTGQMVTHGLIFRLNQILTPCIIMKHCSTLRDFAAEVYATRIALFEAANNAVRSTSSFKPGKLLFRIFYLFTSSIPKLPSQIVYTSAHLLN